MSRRLLCACLVMLVSPAANAQVGNPGIQYSDSIAAGEGGQMFPYDQQDPWLHGQYQRVPAYGGFASFRPYNYRHVFAQTQIASGWGAAHGMPYSQQFWNKYRGSYLNGNLHSQAMPAQVSPTPSMASAVAPPVSRASFVDVTGAATGSQVVSPQVAPGPSTDRVMPVTTDTRPIHVFPGAVPGR